MSIAQPVTTSSVLFDRSFAPQPPAPLTVFDLSPLARALVSECVAVPDAEEPLSPYARSMFAALAAVACRLAQQPSPVTVPAGRSPELRRALALTADGLADDVRFEEVALGEDSVTTIAHAVGYTSLSAFNAAFRDLTGRTPTQYRATFGTAPRSGRHSGPAAVRR